MCVCVCVCVCVRETEIGRKSMCSSLGQSQGKAHTGFLSSESNIPLPLSLWVILFTSLRLTLLICKLGLDQAATGRVAVMRTERDENCRAHWAYESFIFISFSMGIVASRFCVHLCDSVCV